ncbi:MAG: ATP-binding cassette domain-containing protein, partial [Bdellovibrionales bacterium]|nr:ATP-binding cassette domain-containing protein [Bdellovibrionales bacterium]
MLISIDGIKKYYKTKDGVKKALRGIHLFVDHGEFVTISGPSGSGKTTLISILALLMTQSRGKYYYNNEKVHPLDESRKEKIRSSEIGFIFQEGLLLSGLSVYENCALPLLYSGLDKSEVLKRCREALKKVGLEDYIQHKPNQLSGGQQQRVAIARALMNQPKLIIADEPCAALDPDTRLDVLKIFQDLNAEGVTILMVSHSIEDAKFSRRIIRIEDGFLTDDRLVICPDISVRRMREVDFETDKTISDPAMNIEEDKIAQMIELQALSRDEKGFLQSLNRVLHISGFQSLTLCLKVLGLCELDFVDLTGVIKVAYHFIEHPDWKIRLLALRLFAKNIVLLKSGDKSFLKSALQKMLIDANTMVREDAFQLLAERQSELGAEFIKQYVSSGSKDSSPQVRAICAKMLPGIDKKYLSAAFKRFLSDRDFRVVSNAVESLWIVHKEGRAGIGVEDVTGLLQKLAVHDNNRLKANIALIYRNIDEELSKKITLELLNHENPSYIASGIYVASAYFQDLLKSYMPMLID